MTTIVQSKTSTKKRQEWDEAIADAERLARECRLEGSRLRAAIRHFKRMQAEGQPFPGRKRKRLERSVEKVG